MYHTVVVPVDGSPHAEHAIPWALAAAADGATVHLSHVHLPTAPVVVEGVVVADPTLDASVREFDADYVAALVERVRRSAPKVHVSGLALEADEPLPVALTRAAKELSAELVVMATHGRGAFARFLLGSVADDTVRASPVPVLVVRGPEDRGSDLSDRPTVVGGLLVPLDGSPLAEAILGPAVRFATTFRCGITVLMVADAASVPPPVLNREVASSVGEGVNPVGPAREAGQYLDRVVRELQEKGVAVTPRAVKHGDPAVVIRDYVRANTGTVVALATHGRTGLLRLFHRSVTEEIIHASPGPVLVYHPPG